MLYWEWGLFMLVPFGFGWWMCLLKTVDELRSEFPVMERITYLDMAYGNPLANSVREAMEEYLKAFQRDGVSVARDRAYGVLE
jgi:hypothetical protein